MIQHQQHLIGGTIRLRITADADRLAREEVRVDAAGTLNRWIVLALGFAAQAASISFVNGLPVLLPFFRARFDLSLPSATLLVVTPIIGLLLTLVAWGAVADRWGERVVLGTGLFGAGLTLTLPLIVPLDAVALGVVFGLAGALAACANPASGRIVLAAFDRRQRGLVMGIRQTAQPMGTAISAWGLPTATQHLGLPTAVSLTGGLCLVTGTLCTVYVRGAPRAPAGASRSDDGGNPYRDGTLWRLHATSTLLVIPQCVVYVLGVAYLVSGEAFSPAGAGAVMGVAQLAGACGRLAAGRWSDLVQSRLRPIRALALGSAAAMLVLAGVSLTHGGVLAAAAVVVASIITVSDNGLGFTAAAEIAGPSWSGRALGAQNTVQYLAAAAAPPLLGVLITGSGFTAAFALTALAPLLAAPLIPVRSEQLQTSEA